MAHEKTPHTVSFTIPIFEPLPSQYYVRVVSEHWLHAEALLAMNLQGLILPDKSAHPQSSCPQSCKGRVVVDIGFYCCLLLTVSSNWLRGLRGVSKKENIPPSQSMATVLGLGRRSTPFSGAVLCFMLMVSGVSPKNKGSHLF